jgi:two-component system, chemotaxis family, sensor kinase Cph1
MSTLIGEEAPRESSIDWWRHRIHPDDLEQTEHGMQAALEGTDEGWTSEYRFRRADGSWAVTFDRAFIARDRDGTAIRMVGAMIDMTERKRWEEHLARHAADLERSNSDLEDFARVIAHDLKTPLRGIADYSGYLLLDYADRLDEEGRDKLHTLLRLTQRMHDLLDGLMEYARVGRAALRLAETDLNTVLGEVLDSLRSRLQTERVQVALETPLPRVRADPMLIEQVFSNLIINGLKYNTRSEKRIQIGCRRAEDDGEIIYIRDNGIGIEQKHRDSIFQMFRRLHGRDDFGGGTGSGLSIVRKIIERHGGHIWVESTVGEGSTFCFTLGQPRDNDPEPLIPVVRTQHDAPRPR